MAFYLPPVDYAPPQQGYVNIIFVSSATAAKPALPEGVALSSEDDTKFLMGTDDYPLSEQGQIEAARFRDAINSVSELSIARIYSSSLLKSRETAQPLAMSRDLEIIVDDRLKEISKGAIQSSYKSAYSANEQYQKYKKLTVQEQYFEPMGEGGETKEHCTKQMIGFLNDLCKDSSLNGKTIVVFTHGTPLKVLYTLSMEENREAITHPENLREYLHKFLPLDDPKKCEAIQYQLNIENEPALTFNAKLQFNETGITTANYPRLKK